MKILAGSLLALLGLSLVGCNGNAAAPSAGISVVASTGMVADLVRNVGGERVHVEQLMGEDVDPHLFNASTDDVRKLNAADLIFYSGLHLEGKMGDIFVRLARRKPTFAVAEFINEDSVLENEEKLHDPHVWFNVKLWSQAIPGICDVLSQHDPKHAAEYKARADEYQARLEKLHKYAHEQITSIPKERRVLITAHDAFRYFGEAYEIEVRGIQGISTESEASVRDINELVDFIVKRGVKAVFAETSVNPRNMQALIAGCEYRGHNVVLGGQLFSDAMGKEGTSQGTYEGMVMHNVDTIVRALK